MEQRRRFFWNLLLTASFTAATVSLLTTALGLGNYLHVALAWPLALAVQAGLFGLAWLIALPKSRLRWLLIALYTITMPFSVVFSYVMLQSELTAETRTLETRRALVDDLRERSAIVSDEIQRSIAWSEDLRLRLDSWLALERSEGWTAATCAEADHPYLDAVCDRIRRQIESWEAAYQRPYRQGPGERLIYGLLETERQALLRVESTLAGLGDGWIDRQSVLGPGIDNQERLGRFDAALDSLPRREIEMVRPEPLELPSAPDYESFARDVAAGEERPVYAFQDLAILFESDHTWGRSDYPTVFAFALALFIDLFVLLVAIGAGVLADGGEQPVAAAPAATSTDGVLEGEIGRWIEGAVASTGLAAGERIGFLTGVMASLELDASGRSVLLATDAVQARFGHLLVASHAARPRAESAATPAFELQDWVLPALSRYLAAARLTV